MSYKRAIAYAKSINSPKVPLTIEEYTTQLEKRARRGQPTLPRGTKVFLVSYGLFGYFSYCYLRRIDAETAAENARRLGTDCAFFAQWNCTRDPETCRHVWNLATVEGSPTEKDFAEAQAS